MMGKKMSCGRGGSRRSSGRGSIAAAAIVTRIRFARSCCGNASSSTRLLHGTLLLTGRKRFLELAIDEEVTEDATGTPGDAVCPSLDARRIFFVDEHASTADQVTAFPIVWSTSNGRQHSGQTGFEEDQGIVRGCDVSGERRGHDGRRCTLDHC